MNIEYALNQMQALLTKLRGRLRDTGTARTCVGTCGGKAREGSNYCQPCMDARILDTIGERLTGTADPCKCWVCGEPAVMGQGNAIGATIGFCKEHIPQTSTKTARECTCVSGVVGDDCPVHPESTWDGKPQEGYGYFATPDLPLHARVAKANGKDVKYLEGVTLGKDGWYYWNPHAHDGAQWYPVPDFPNDLVAAMGALFEYGEKTKWQVSVGKRQYGHYVWAKIGDMNYELDKSLPQAICLAIVAHREAR